MPRWSAPLCLCFCLILSGCAAEHSHPFEPVAKTVADRTGFSVRYDHERPPEVDAAIIALLAQPLTLNSAIKIALLNNRSLAAEFEEIGIAQAEFVTAAQIKNPSFGIDARPPDKPPSGTDIEASLMFDVLDLFMLPIRKKIAANQLTQATLHAGDAALRLVHDVRVAYFRYISQQQLLIVQRQMTEATETAQDFAARQHDAGNINDLALIKQQSAAVQAKLDLLQAESLLTIDRESLNHLLSLSDAQMNWSTSESLPEPAGPEATPQSIESIAADRRLDLEIARRHVVLAQQALVYTRQGVLTDLNVGVSSERESSGQTVVGPALSLEIPIFNQHQGQIARAEAELREARKNLDAMTFEMQSSVRLAVDQLKTAREAADLANHQLVPDRMKAVALPQQQYNGMLAGQYTLLAAKQDELTAREQGIELLRDYWIAHVDLDRAMGN